MLNYNDLYYSKELKVSMPEVASYPIELSIELRGLIDTTPDCRIGHFGYNFWFRTNKGLKAEKYQSEQKLQQAIEQSCKKRGIQVLGWIDKN